MRYTYAQTLAPIAVVAKFFQLYRDEADKAGYQASPDQLAWSNTIYVADTDAKAMREAKPHLEALVNRFLKMPTEMLLPPGYTNINSMKRIRAAKVTGKPQTDRGPGQEPASSSSAARTRCARSSPSTRTSPASTPR